jgi:hypothetical protein
LGTPALNLDDPFSDRRGTIQHSWERPPNEAGTFFTILALLSLLASIAMAMNKNWRAAFACVAAGFFFVMAIV